MPKREETKRMNVVLSVQMFNALRAAARRQHRTKSSIIREALGQYLGVADTVEIGGGFERREDSEGQMVGVLSNAR